MSKKKLHNADVMPENVQEAQPKEDPNADRKFYAKVIVGVVALLVVFALCLFLSNKESKQENLHALTIDGEQYNTIDLNYYYFNTLNQYSSYLSMFGVDPNKDLDDQQYTEEMSWGDYFRDEAISAMTQIVSMYHTAMDAGYEISAELQEDIDAYSKSVDDFCSSNSISRSQFLTAQYGSHMTDEIFMKHVTMMFVASDYATTYTENATYTDDEILSFYEENKLKIDWADYEVLTVDADYTGIEGTAEGSTAEKPKYTEEETAQAMDAAKATANAFLDRVDAGEKLADIAAEYNKDNYVVKEDTAYASSYAYSEWVFDDSRSAGDTTMVKDETGECWYIVVFNERTRPAYNTIDVRHILIQPEATDLSTDDEGYDAAVEQKKGEAKAKANDILNQYLSGAQTEDAFAALAKEHSSDGSASVGGLYTKVYLGQMVDAFEDWCFDEGRQIGDTGVVETPYGFHVMYFAGENLPYWQVASITGLNTQWENDVYTSATVEEFEDGIKAVG